MTEKRERYVQGKMSPEEAQAFLSELTSEEQQELAFELGVKEGIGDKLRSDLREQVGQFEISARNKTESRFRPLSIAASILLLIGLSYWYFLSSSSLYEEYYSVYPNYEVTALRNNDDLTIREQAYLAYDDGRYHAAIDLFDQLIVENNDLPAHFFKGLGHLELGQMKEGQQHFLEVINAGHPDYEDAAIWYLALTYIKKDQYPEAKAWLQRLENSEDYSSLSKELASRL